MNQPITYDLSDGWINASLKPITESDLPVWVWREGFAQPAFAPFWAAVYDAQFWRPAKLSVPLPPRRLTEDELERAACLAAWRRQSIDFAECGWHDLPQDWIDGWMAARKASKIQATNHST